MTSSMIKQNIMSLSMYDESTSSHGHGASSTLPQSAHNGQILHNGQAMSYNSSFGDGLDKLKDAASAITGTRINQGFFVGIRSGIVDGIFMIGFNERTGKCHCR